MIRIVSADGGPGEPPRWFVALLLYAGGLVLLVFLAFALGVGIADMQCQEEDSDCDLGFLLGLECAFVAFWVGLLAIIANESRLAVRRRDA